MSRQSIDQDRAGPDDLVEVRIRPLIACQTKCFGDGSGLQLLFWDARCRPSASPVMEGNGHRCVSLKHAFRPFLEVG
jgi:hypothetical protein